MNQPIDPTPEVIQERAKAIRENGYADAKGKWHRPWSQETYIRRLGYTKENRIPKVLAQIVSLTELINDGVLDPSFDPARLSD